MISDFDLLAHKVSELAELAHSLRRENAALRAQMTTLSEENGELGRRMVLAHDRVTALLSRLPDPQALVAADADQQEPA